MEICSAWRRIVATPLSAIALAFFMLSVGFTAPTASATVLIQHDHGGHMRAYEQRFAQLRDSGEHVVVDGACLSACTMMLGMLPRAKVCATPNAVFGFHAAWDFDRHGRKTTSLSGTRDLLAAYPADVRAWIARKGGLTPNLILLRGRELASIVPPCPKSLAWTTNKGWSAVSVTGPGKESAWAHVP